MIVPVYDTVPDYVNETDVFYKCVRSLELNAVSGDRFLTRYRWGLDHDDGTNIMVMVC